MKLPFFSLPSILLGLFTYVSFEDKLKSSPIEKEKGSGYVRLFNKELSCVKTKSEIGCKETNRPFLIRSKDEELLCYVLLTQQYKKQKIRAYNND